ncbi:2-oxo acid dehydrogenase subunit E2 [Spiroplasma poulsonii]|uniref:Dihydrolipoyllysine-residue acetyltransferase component of pyruvate dehydrogenase complex n=1 Tax=Spiroplasma poulsonii TaxID=2138 RepID=A0A2P6FFU7_9MOLU|nr:2-oxo acid dehydrogenase subunit E2 [Spiroplasma poulsonii]KAF0850164.1 Dihydrolipoyllysine-residue acetyltransferase component of pyruvate dehydrogenase complex [Spiroplasma poulsonii]PQM32342.1 Dihydrolipoyllysine-residue acetyltransferase component of pyruvate dehydrogenase complex [Spiroplasma poulsonii]PWF94997.1 Dihydrolipoyllysine-residue acetyltransferase component of pyruvate dehydrogenase complex [Spiroplasma poulsonii]PWF97791.1 Dihydrolipoyllysine-residue acetyltransferase compon
MEKIKVSFLEKKGILKEFLYQDVAVKAGDDIALIESNNGEAIIKASMDGIIVKPIKAGSKIKKNAVIAHLLTTETEIEKYYFKHLENNKFSHLDKKGVVFTTTKNGEFGTKWKDVEEDDYSGINLVKSDTLNPTFTPPLLDQQQMQNNSEATQSNYNEMNIDYKVELINEAPLSNESFGQGFEQNNLNQPLPTTMDFNNMGQPINNSNFINNTMVQPTPTMEQQTISESKPTEIKRWDETELTFGPKKTRRLSFKDFDIDDDHIINNRAKIPSIDTIKQPSNQNVRSEENNMMINMPNINDVMKENNFDSAVSSLNVKTQSTGQNIIANAVPIGQKKIEEENQAKEYAKYLVNETKHQDEAPANAAALFGNQAENSSFRNLVNKRRQQLHNKNDFHELSLESDNSKSSMDFLDDDGRPKILRNIVQGRMNDLIKRNASPEMLSGQSGGSTYGYDQPDYRAKDDDLSDEVYISADGYTVDPKDTEKSAPKKPSYFSPLKSYRDRLYEKLNDGEQREKILKTRNQRELIKKRMEQIAKGNVEVDSVLGEINNYRRPSFEEIESQYEMLDNEYYGNENQHHEQSTTKHQQGFANQNKNQPGYGPVNQEIKQGTGSVTPITNNYQCPSTQQSASDNTMLVELAVLKEKLLNQEQSNRQNELLREIQSLRETNNNMNQNNNVNNLDKMMQYMLMQQMLKTMNAPDPMLKEMLKEFNLNNKQTLNQGIENTSGGNNLQVKKFDSETNAIPNTYGNLVQPLNNSLNIVNTNSKIEPQGLETREEIKATRYPAIQSMIMSQTHVPPLTINAEIDMSSIIDQQRKLKNANTEYGVRFSTMSFLVKAVSLALSEYPKLNSYYDSKTNQIVIKNSQHIGLATETSEGLVIPVIKFTERMSLKQIAINIQETIERLRQGELYDYELQGSTITIANYGTVGAVNATPTIFYPNSAVIGIGRIVRKPVVIKGDKLVIRSMMNIALTVDQRIIDAAEAGIFLTRLKEILEAPELITLS